MFICASYEVSKFAKFPFVQITKFYNRPLVEWDYDNNYVHIIFKAQKKIELTKLSIFIKVLVHVLSDMISKELNLLASMVYTQNSSTLSMKP